MPSAPPISWAVSAIADAAPARSLGTDARMVSLVTAKVNPMPREATIMASTMYA